MPAPAAWARAGPRRPAGCLKQAHGRPRRPSSTRSTVAAASGSPSPGAGCAACFYGFCKGCSAAKRGPLRPRFALLAVRWVAGRACAPLHALAAWAGVGLRWQAPLARREFPPPATAGGGTCARRPECVQHPAHRDRREPSTSPCRSRDATIPSTSTSAAAPPHPPPRLLRLLHRPAQQHPSTTQASTSATLRQRRRRRRARELTPANQGESSPHPPPCFSKILAKIVESLYKIMPFAWDYQEWYCQQRDRRKIPSLPVWQNRFYQVCVLKVHAGLRIITIMAVHFNHYHHASLLKS